VTRQGSFSLSSSYDSNQAQGIMALLGVNNFFREFVGYHL